MGWSGLTNGQLLKIADQHSDVFLTADSNLTFQQNLTKYELAVIVMEARRVRLVDTLALMPQVLAALTTISHEKLNGLGRRRKLSDRRQCRSSTSTGRASWGS